MAGDGAKAVVLLVIWAFACGEPEPGPAGATETDPSTTSTTGADTSGGEESTTTWVLPDVGPPTPHQTQSCSYWLACATELGVAGLDELDATYGTDGTCWDGDSAQALTCDGECKDQLAAAVMELEAMGQAVPEACDPPPLVSWAAIEEILSDNCVTACHEPGGEDASLDLSDGPYYAIYGVASDQSLLYLVDAGSKEDSYLWHKVNGSQGSVSGSGSRMPKGAPALTVEQIEAIGDWIDGGAPYF